MEKMITKELVETTYLWCAGRLDNSHDAADAHLYLSVRYIRIVDAVDKADLSRARHSVVSRRGRLTLPRGGGVYPARDPHHCH